MRIAIVLNTSWNIYNFRKGLVLSLLAKGHEVHTLAPLDEYSKELIDLGCHYHPIRMDSRGVNPVKDFALLTELFFKYRRIAPDLVLHYTIKPNIYGTIAASILNIPAINNVCGLGTAFLDKNFVSRIALALYRFSFRTPKKIFFQNKDDRKFFLSKGIARKAQAEILPGSGIDPAAFTSKSQIGKSRAKPFTFLLISRLIYDKGILEYIEAIRILREQGMQAEFQLLGASDPSHRRGISAEIIDSWLAQDSVDYLGSTTDVRPYIESADCVVLPSYREGTPRTLLEAASMRRPIVASNVPGCRNIVRHNVNGFLCKVKDPLDLAKKMKRMANSEETELKMMGTNGRMIIEEKFDEQIVIGKYLEVIGQLENQPDS